MATTLLAPSITLAEVQTEGAAGGFYCTLQKPSGPGTLTPIIAAELTALTLTLYDAATYDPNVASFTDLVIGATTTELSSVLRPFTVADEDRIVKVTAGSGFTAGSYRVVSVAAPVATMDRSVGTGGSTGGIGRLIGGIINGLHESSILNTGRGTFHATSGLLTISLHDADNPIITASTVGTRERHVARILASYNGGIDSLRQEVIFYVTNWLGVP